MERNKTISLSVYYFALAATLSLSASAQSSAKVSFPSVLDGGSVGVPSNLRGTIAFSADRVVFEAFPEVENVTLPCSAIKEVKPARWNSHVIKIVSATATYRFDLLTPAQAQQWVATLRSSCLKSESR